MKKNRAIAIILIMLILLAGCAPLAGEHPLATATAVPGPVGQAGNWSLVWNDEFSTTSLDLNKWRPNWLAGTDTAITNPMNTSEVNCYNPRNVTVADGLLVLAAVARTDEAVCNTRNGTAHYSGGMVQSYNHFTFTYGYFEARAKFPAGTGVWPAIWTDGAGLNWPTTGEIDTVECYGTDASCSFHYHYPGGDPGGNYTVVGSTTDFHTYGYYWEPGRITWYYDGKQVYQYTTGIINVPHFIIVNLGLRGTSPTVPSYSYIDYVRVWKLSGSATVTPTMINATNTPSQTRTATRTTTPTPSQTATRSQTPSLTRSITPSQTGTIPPTVTNSKTPTITPTETETIIPTSIIPSLTPTPTEWCQYLYFGDVKVKVCLP